jgi:D-alanine-D-alanine ligase
MERPRVLVLYNQPVLPANHRDAESEHEILETADDVAKSLIAAGFPVDQFGLNHQPGELLNALERFRPQVIFNLYEGAAREGETEAYVGALLQWVKIPFTGSPFQTLCLARDKPLTKRLLLGAGLPTPRFMVVDSAQAPACPLPWPVIVKPSNQDASVGMGQESVATSREALNKRVAWIAENYGTPVLVEEFIFGRELIIGMVEHPDITTLPVAEIQFTRSDPGYWPIVSYDAKWAPGSPEYETTPPRYPTDLGPDLEARLNHMAKTAYELVGCRDYGRVDFRLTAAGEPYILEVNPNPDINPSAGFSGGLGAISLTHPQFVVNLVWRAWERRQKIEDGRIP